VRLTGGDALAIRASKKLRTDELLITSLGATILCKHLDSVPLWRGDHVAIRQVVDDFARYLYLPRVAGPEVLLHAIRDGITLLTWRTETFAYSEGFDETASRYRGLRGGLAANISSDSTGLLVKADVAGAQLDAEGQAIMISSLPGVQDGKPSPGSSEEKTQPTQPVPQMLRRFHGTVMLDSTRVGRDAGRIADEVIAHLAGQMGSQVTVTIEIEAMFPNGASDPLMRTVTENSRTLKFETFGFETD